MNEFIVDKYAVQFATLPDLFSPKGLDGGTRLLLCAFGLPSVEGKVEEAKVQSILDWGCGWGAIALWSAKNWPQAQITAIDSDIAAIATTRANASANGLSHLKIVASHGFSELGQQKFNLILSNPPTHRGRKVVDSMVAEAFARLEPKGLLIIVVEARLKPWVARQITEVFGSYKIAKRGPKHVVLLGVKG